MENQFKVGDEVEAIASDAHRFKTGTLCKIEKISDINPNESWFFAKDAEGMGQILVASEMKKV